MCRNGPTRVWRRICPIRLAFDRGLAPFQILVNLKAAHDALGTHASLEGLTTGVPFTIPGLRAVPHPHQAQFAHLRRARRCRGQVRLREPADAWRAGEDTAEATGDHFGATLPHRRAEEGRLDRVAVGQGGRVLEDRVLADGAGARSRRRPRRRRPSPRSCGSRPTSPSCNAAKSFVETWLIRKDYDAAFRYLSTRSYACYDLVRGPDAPASTSLDDAGRKIRASLERVGQWVGTPRNLEAIVEAAEPLHPSIRVMDQPYSRIFSLTSFPAHLATPSSVTPAPVARCRPIPCRSNTEKPSA